MARPSTRDKVVDAALRCLAREGLRRTTVDDVAVEAGVSRATLYRAFPGGRETILMAVVDAEADRLFDAVAAAVAPAAELGDALVAGLGCAAAWLTSHAALERVMFDEPAVVLTHLEFEQLDRTLAHCSRRLAPLLTPWLDADAAARAGEWVARVCVSYLLFPGDDVDLGAPGPLERLVVRHVLPGVQAFAGAAGLPVAVASGETVSTKLS
jgi:AcrR family transcriptional regulator